MNSIIEQYNSLSFSIVGAIARNDKKSLEILLEEITDIWCNYKFFMKKKLSKQTFNGIALLIRGYNYEKQ